ncbi:MAG: serine protease, partial [Acidobacteria bacterium]|nr:serine protease [Acidobacteriota bacterium]
MRFRPFRLVAAIVALGVSVPFAFAAPKRAAILNANPHNPSRYIVTLNGDVSDVEASTNDLVQSNGGQLKQLHRFLRAFTVELPESEALRIAADPRVKFVEQDSPIHANATQTSAPWGLDRIDQRDRPGDTTYVYNSTGAGVTAYIVDSGINTTHGDFGGRVTVGTDTVADGHNGVDCNGHGTHVAGTVGGTTYGVAKGVSLVSVRVLDCTGSGFVSGIITGVNWAIGNHTTGLAVMNVSVGADSPSQTFDDAITNAVADGIVVCVAAGNGTANDGVAIDTCGSSPGRTPNAITVSASDAIDVRGSFANFGTCVDIFAPGVSIVSDWYTSNSATATLSGTSMATPHVTGAAALYLQSNPLATPAAVAAGLVASASQNKLTSIGTGSPNRLLYTADIGTSSSCGTNGVTTTPGAAVAAVSPGGSVSSGAPAVANLPAGGVWQKTQRKDGETWTYTFQVAAKGAGAKPAAAPGDGSTISQPRALPINPELPVAISGRRETTSINGLPLTGDILQPRAVTAKDAPPTLDLHDLSTGASAAEGTTTVAIGSSLHVARLAVPASLAAAGQDGLGLTAVDATFRDLHADEEASSVRVFLRLKHPDPGHVTAWLAAGDRDVLLWDGANETSAAGDSIVVDRLFPRQLAGRSLHDRWTIYLSDSGASRTGVLEQAWIAITAAPHTAADATRGTATIDIVAQRAYMMTGASLSGVEVDPPAVAQTVYLYADFQIAGTGSATVSQRAMLDGSSFCSGSTMQPAGFYYVFCNSSWSPTAGSHTLQWDLDYLNTVVETNENNNSASKSFTPTAGGVDIFNERSYLMTGASLGGSEVNTPAVGQAVYLYADYSVNAGSAITVSQRALMDGTLYCSGSAFQNGGLYYVFCNSTWTATAGSHTLQWDLDYNNAVVETNEGNNSSSKTFTPSTGVDIAAQRAYLRTAPSLGGVEVDPPTVGQVVYLYGDYQVVGAVSPVTI